LRFLIDRCAGRRLAEWLRRQGHDVLEVSALGRDPGDAALLRLAAEERRVLVTIDTNFGALIHVGSQVYAGLIRLPDVPAARRIEVMTQILSDHGEEELSRAVVTVKGRRIRISRHAQPAPPAPRPGRGR
jgi:predicted nuclease of predicted toxin-antitoxin system